MNYLDLQIDKLPSRMVGTKLIKGIGKYSYEDYLLEFVNASSFFIEKSKGHVYRHPDQESGGENDCISDYYELDFKLIDSEKWLQADSIFSFQYDVPIPGIIMKESPKVKSSDKAYKPLKATRIHAALREKSLSDLSELRCQRQVDEISEIDIIALLETVEKQKNLFLFFPYKLYFDNNNDINIGRQIAIDGISGDFKGLIEYRRINCPDKDTYFAFIYEQEMVILGCYGNSFFFIESIPCQKSERYMWLLNLE